MRIQPRQHLLDIWKATVRSSWRDGAWQWGGRDGSNSISDAEQLLCILLPATTLRSFALDRPDATADTMARALAPLGTELTIPRNLARILADYFERYTADGRPVFAGGSYVTPAQQDRGGRGREHDLVESFAVSVTLSLAAISFVRVFRHSVARDSLRRELRSVERRASARLTAAMVGLLRSFSTHVFDADDTPGRALIAALDQDGLPARRVVAQLRAELRETIASFAEVVSGSGQTTELEGDHRLFECGWSWGIVADAPRVELVKAEEAREPEDAAADVGDFIGEQPAGVAENRPSLYFTAIALDAIEDLFSERTRVLGLLNEEQQRLARALQLRWDLTVSYWSTVATFGGTAWPLENVPWRTTDGQVSDHHTLLVASIVVKDLVRRRGSDSSLAQVGSVYDKLANRSGVLRRFQPEDSRGLLHPSGLVVPLVEGGEHAAAVPASWAVRDFTTFLLRRSVVVAGLMYDVEARTRLLHLVDRLWEHLESRRLGPGTVIGPQPSWYHTVRLVQCMVVLGELLSREPIVNDRLVERARDLLTEAEQLYDRELMVGTAETSGAVHDLLTGIRLRLERARSMLPSRPGTAVSLVASVLHELDSLDAVRGDDGAPAS